LLLPKTAITGIGWPAMPAPVGASMLAMQFQLEQSQWWPPEVLAQQQLRQAGLLLQHVYDTVPFYRERLEAAGWRPGAAITSQMWARVPLLARADIQASGEALRSKAPPADHGRLLEYQSSGSTGEPIHTWGSEVTHFFWGALTLRDHLWHRRDLGGKLAAIRTKVKEEALPGWGPSTDVVYATGPSATLDVSTDVDDQLRWLERNEPDYLLTHPSNALALARRSLELGLRLPSLREVRSFGEMLPPELRPACREAWSVPVTDSYSAREVGYIALQCPGHEHYHVQAENLLVEVLREDGAACRPGEIGRVVLTTLHNFVMPLIRYAIGDYAKAGERCACGRGLPVLERIMGRQRNMVILPDGTRHWPYFPLKSWMHIAPLRQIQLVQKSREHIEARLVVAAPLDPEQERQFARTLQDSLGYPITVTFRYPERIERAPGFKYEDFISEVAP
jgi:phenylacetate-CoA ligase